MPDLGNFGWTQLLSSIGLILTSLIALFGFRTFNRWKREKIEERRIEIAFEALSLAYKAKYIFQHIRSSSAQSHEWVDMPKVEGEDESSRMSRGVYYATLNRLNFHKDYFDEAWRLQPRCMIIFGRNIERTFSKLIQARVRVQISAERLISRGTFRSGRSDAGEIARRERWERDIWNDPGEECADDAVGNLIREFERELEAAAKPILDRTFKPV